MTDEIMPEPENFCCLLGRTSERIRCATILELRVTCRDSLFRPPFATLRSLSIIQLMPIT